MYIIIAIALGLLASVLDWQKDKSSLKAAWEKNFLKYLAIMAACIFYSYFPKWAAALSAGALVYFGWSLIAQLVARIFKKKQ